MIDINPQCPGIPHGRHCSGFGWTGIRSAIPDTSTPFRLS
jgi:hypothetical protein